MEKLIKEAVNASRIKRFGGGGGGCISDGQSYDTDKGKYFVKVNGRGEARRMFDGEQASLEAILATNTVRCPKPVAVLDNPTGTGAIFIMEHLDIGGLNRHSATLGEQLARMHLHNGKLRAKAKQDEGRVESTGDGEGDSEGTASYISQFGFHSTTCCGYLPQENSWTDDWVSFYAQQRLKFQLDLIEKDSGDREARELWPRLERKIPEFFHGLDIVPALLHGDLWGGNVGQLEDCPVIFDAASFYGHHEFDLSIAGMFGGFSKAFYSSYHRIIPKAPGFDQRHELYKLFHYINHWNHFGSGYRGSSLSIMRSLVRD
ncbi:ketosamine-3-kinase-like isoform X1 [Diadema setosum]|uniref:ketosamine-3-kinase-like isoform X1 n=1 Tax=Diadema setosum TaxID=31175 RepID=UPI003B3AF172